MSDNTQRPSIPSFRQRMFGSTSASVLAATREQIDKTLEQNPKPTPGRSLLASAAKISKSQTGDAGFRKFAAKQSEWQEDGWAMYDLVGELRFLVDTLASRGSKAHFYVGDLTDGAKDEPEPTADTEVSDLLDFIGDGQVGLQRMVERLISNLKIPGEGWLVGIPRDIIERMNRAVEGKISAEEINPRANSLSKGGIDTYSPSKRRINRAKGLEQGDRELVEEANTGDLANYEWRMMSITEIQFSSEGDAIINMGPSAVEQLTLDPDDIYLVRVHKPHPSIAWQADSPTRSALPILRELVGLTMHISAQIDSRLAGAGVFIVPESYSKAVKRAMNLPEDSDEDPITEAMMQGMIAPIGDRSAAAAVVPLVFIVPDEAADKFKHITFSQGLDMQAPELRNETIKRLALSWDAPPEILTGTSGMNHWGGWLSREDVVRTHLEPVLALICDAVTTQYLRPAIEENFPEIDAKKKVVWYDVEHLIVRTSQGQDAIALHAIDALSDESLRKYNGFDETDAPKQAEDKQRAIDAVFAMVEQNPGLMRRPGIDVLVKQMEALLKGNPLGADDMVQQAAAAAETAEDIEQETGVEVSGDGEEETPANDTPASVGSSGASANSGGSTGGKPAGPTTGGPPGPGNPAAAAIAAIPLAHMQPGERTPASQAAPGLKGAVMDLSAIPGLRGSLREQMAADAAELTLGQFGEER